MTHPKWLEEIDHTGDCGFRVTAADVSRLFIRAATAMMQIITDLQQVTASEKVSFAIAARDRDALLRQWLSQLNYYHISNDFLFSRFEISRISETELAAIGIGEKIDFDRHQIFTEIKAVTFHGLKIESSNAGWVAQIIFDL